MHLLTLCAKFVVSILTILSFICIFPNPKPDELTGDVQAYLWNEGGCGLRWSTPYIKVCVISRQIFSLGKRFVANSQHSHKKCVEKKKDTN